jgi:dinuclear metal center YbgI/SA1388 family protein
MKIAKITGALEEFAPPALQESYDNAGLIVGSSDAETGKVLITVDVTEDVVDEAIATGAGLIVAHHPIVFSGLKKLNGKNYVERVVMKAIKHDIAIYAIHTNLDNILEGTNKYLAELLGLTNLKVLSPAGGQLLKLVVFCPLSHAGKVRDAIFGAGAGVIGNYDRCSFNAEGSGSFRAGDNTNPFAGEKGKEHFEEEVRIETILPFYLKGKVINAMLAAHPYEEVAYDIYRLENKTFKTGSGITGTLKEEMKTTDFLKKLKDVTGAGCIRHTKIVKPTVKKIALCGGSGAFLINAAKSAGADIYITGDVKYHEFFDAGEKMIIADTGHYETEQFTVEILYDFIKEKFPTFAVQKSDIVTNPISYL